MDKILNWCQGRTYSILYVSCPLIYPHHMKVRSPYKTWSLNCVKNFSLIGYYGHIRYSIKITLERSWKFNQKFKRRFTVLKHLDLNQFPDLQRPLKVDDKKDFTWSMFTKGPINLSAAIPLGGFVPGQALPFTIFVDNPSKVDVTSIEIKLKQVSCDASFLFFAEFNSIIIFFF